LSDPGPPPDRGGAGGPPLLALTQGDPAGIGPELMLKLLAASGGVAARFVLVAERAALEAVRDVVPPTVWARLDFGGAAADRQALLARHPRVPVLDPTGRREPVAPGRSAAAEARGALAALERGAELALGGVADALVTLPVSKASIATHVDPGFRGHTDWLAARAGLERYGRDYLMCFLAPDLRVALLTVHLPLREALDRITEEALVDALGCLHRHAPGRIAVAGINPHAGEGGLLGDDDERIVRPAVERARGLGIDARGPESPDSVFGRARAGLADWVLALYHDQGLIAIKTAAWGRATNWTLGLPYLRTSVDHGTAFDIAGQGQADVSSLRTVVAETLRLLEQGERGGVGG
jgi:4-hydroxythreonine-4-phosphate dehydrogenase